MSKMKILLKVTILILSFSVSACTQSSNLSSPLAPDVSELDDIFVEGIFIEGELNSLTIRQEDGKEIPLQLSAQTIYWDENEWMNKTPAKIGDQIQAYGSWKKDQSAFEVKSYYANRVDLKGVVFYVCGETEAFMLDQPDQKYIILPLPQKTELRTETPTDPTSYKYYDLMPNFGEELQVIGREFEEPFLVAVVMTRMD
jgi:hypothetical protein